MTSYVPTYEGSASNTRTRMPTYAQCACLCVTIILSRNGDYLKNNVLDSSLNVIRDLSHVFVTRIVIVFDLATISTAQTYCTRRLRRNTPWVIYLKCNPNIFDTWSYIFVLQPVVTLPNLHVNYASYNCRTFKPDVILKATDWAASFV
jgi:hypothetical protein